MSETASAPAAPMASGTGTPATTATTGGDIKVSDASPKTSSSTTSANTKSWIEGFSPEQADYIATKGFQSPQAVLESYMNLEKLRGVPQERLLKLPESPDADGWQAVYSKLGKPETPEGYDIQVAEGGDENFAKWAKEAFHKLNLTKSQAQGFIEKLVDYNTQNEITATEQYKANVQKQEMNLRKEWGSAYHQNVANAQRAYKAFGIPDNAVAALEKEMGFDGLMKLMNDIGSKMGEDAYIDGVRSREFGDVLTPEQARAKISNLKRDSEFTKKFLAGDTEARAKMSRLHQMAYPESKL